MRSAKQDDLRSIISFSLVVNLIHFRLDTSLRDDPSVSNAVSCPLCFKTFGDRQSLKSHIVECSPTKKVTKPTTEIHSPHLENLHSIEDLQSEDLPSDLSEAAEDIEASLGELSELSNSCESSEDDFSHCSGKKMLKDILVDKEPEKVNQLPYDINGTKVYEVRGSSRAQLLQKLKDGRPWKKDSRTTWSGYKTVRYRDCSGSFTCPNTECAYFIQYERVNKVHFDKNGVCKICSIQGNWCSCDARKYIAFVDDNEAHVFHYGEHTCEAKAASNRPTDLVQKAVMADPNTKPTEIQSNAILSDLRRKKGWAEVKETVKRVTNIRSISNEKVKQKKVIQPTGQSYKAIREFQDYVSENDKYLIYEINENLQYVFKTSKQKLLLAKEMKRDGNSYMNAEYCYFDGNFKRVKHFVSLTASVYHPLLCKQVTLATMECKHEDKDNIEIFWRVLNKAYKEVNGGDEKFLPVGWCTDMASGNFIGLVRIYGEDVLDTVKGCEFHYKDSVNKKAKSFGESKEQFTAMALSLLTAATPEAYYVARQKLQSFLKNETTPDLTSWLKWWHDRRDLIFRAFTLKESPHSNLAEVIHAGWKHRDRMGVSLLDACFFDVRDSLLLESLFEGLANGAYVVGYGPNQGQLEKIRSDKNVRAAEKTGQDILDFGVSQNLQDAKRSLFTSQNEGCNPPKRKKNYNEAEMFNKRMAASSTESATLKIRNIKDVSNTKREFAVCSSIKSRTNYVIQICSSPSCTCPDSQKNGMRVFCKHILFVLRYALQVDEEDTMLKARYLPEEDVKALLSNKPSNTINAAYIQKVKKSTRKKTDLQEILAKHPLFTLPQKVRLMHKANRSAKCQGRSCKAVISIGIMCIKVEGSLTVPFDRNEAVKQDFYFCPQRSCLSTMPIWSNVRYPQSVEADQGIADSDKDDVARDLGISVV